MIDLKEKSDPLFRHLIGKRVECWDRRGERHVGVLEFAGINDMLHGRFQVTIARCPIWPIDPNTIKEITP